MLCNSSCALCSNQIGKEKIVTWETKSNRPHTDGYHSFRQWVNEGRVEARGEAAATHRYPGESVGDVGSGIHKDKDFQGQVGCLHG